MISDTASEAMASITYNTSGTRLPVLCTALKILITSKLLARQQKIVSSLHFFFTSASVPNLLHSALTGQSDSDSKQERGFHRYHRFCPFIHIMAALFLVSVFTYLRHIISVCVFLLSFKRSKRADPLQSFNSLKDTFSLQNLYSHFYSSYP